MWYVGPFVLGDRRWAEEGGDQGRTWTGKGLVRIYTVREPSRCGRERRTVRRNRVKRVCAGREPDSTGEGSGVTAWDGDATSSEGVSTANTGWVSHCLPGGGYPGVGFLYL